MRLRAQMLLGTAAISAVVVVTLLGIVAPRLEQSFAALEYGAVRQDLARATNAIRAELAALQGTAEDWGAWDDTVAFVRGQAPDYVEQNLMPWSMENLRLDFMVFYDEAGRRVLARGFDAAEAAIAEVGEPTLSALGRVLESLRAEAIESAAELVDLGGEFALVAFTPILDSEQRGPSAGTVALGRLLTVGSLADLASQVQLPLSIRSLESDVVPPSAGDQLAREGFAVAPLDERVIAGYALWPTRTGAPAVVSFATPRTIFQTGQRTVRVLMASLLAILVATAVGFLLFLRSRILSRTSGLAAEVGKIAASGDRSGRVSVSGQDELADLGRQINGMLRALEASNAALERSEGRYRNLFESSRDPIYITTADGAFVDVNRALLDLFGYAKEELKTLSAASLYARVEDREAFRALIDEKGFVANYPVSLRKKDGTHVECLLTTIAEEAPGGSGRHYQGILRDVTEILRHQERLTYLATHDPLTGLLTRGALDDVLQLEIARAMRNLERLAVFYLDLDRFKAINDTHGHAAGDRLLQDVAQRLRASLRASDAVARLGGDEFVALLPGIDSPRDAEIAAEKVVRALRDAFRIDGEKLDLSVSIGIALCPDDGESPIRLLQRADAAMYSVKGLGRNGWKRCSASDGSPS
ncbi:MAG: diguanylate cyclase [Candidatus Bipolaricaulota bacterium]